MRTLTGRGKLAKERFCFPLFLIYAFLCVSASLREDCFSVPRLAFSPLHLCESHKLFLTPARLRSLKACLHANTHRQGQARQGKILLSLFPYLCFPLRPCVSAGGLLFRSTFRIHPSAIGLLQRPPRLALITDYSSPITGSHLVVSARVTSFSSRPLACARSRPACMRTLTGRGKLAKNSLKSRMTQIPRMPLIPLGNCLVQSTSFPHASIRVIRSICAIRDTSCRSSCCCFPWRPVCQNTTTDRPLRLCERTAFPFHVLHSALCISAGGNLFPFRVPHSDFRLRSPFRVRLATLVLVSQDGGTGRCIPRSFADDTG